MAEIKKVWLCILLMFAYRLDAQQSGCDRQTIVVNAYDKQGKFVPSLLPDDFRVKVDERDSRVVSATRASGGNRVVIVLDQSGSMSSALKRKVSQAVASELVRRSPSNSQIALIVFRDQIVSTLGFGHSREEVLSAISNATKSPGQGRSALYDALLYADQILRPLRPGDAVLVLGHGDNSHSKASLKDLEHAYESSGSRIFLMEMVDDYFQTVSLTDTRLDVNRLITGSGGEVWKTLYFDDAVSAVTQDIEDRLWNYYLLEIGPTQDPSKPFRLKVELAKTSGRKGDAKLGYVEKLLPCQ